MALLDRFKKKKDDDQAVAQAAPVKAKSVVAPAKVGKTPAPVKSQKPAAPSTPVVGGSSAYAVLIEPLVTEKATMTGTYYFRVSRSANKSEIAKAIEAVYKVKPLSVRVMNMAGKKVRSGQKQPGQRSDWKKAIIRLKAGETMNVYEGT